jgi:hypothetical protein
MQISRVTNHFSGVEEPLMFRVKSSRTDEWYSVNIVHQADGSDNSVCSCKGFYFNGKCKHAGGVSQLFYNEITAALAAKDAHIILKYRRDHQIPKVDGIATGQPIVIQNINRALGYAMGVLNGIQMSLGGMENMGIRENIKKALEKINTIIEEG